MKKIQILLSMMFCVVLAACENHLSADDETLHGQLSGNLILSVFQLEQTPFSTITRSETIDLCSRLNFAIYDLSGSRLKQTNQVASDSDFGTAAFQLPEGSYELIVLAHSSSGNPTMTNPVKIQFSNSLGYSDTFLYDNTITIGTEPQQIDVNLNRISTLCRFVINDSIPDGVNKLQFKYKGGSGHFNARTGLGVTNSIQTVSFQVQPGTCPSQYDLYTFLHDTAGNLNLQVTALDASENVLFERTFDVPLQEKKITWMQGDFFTGQSSSVSQTITITINDQWSGEQHITY